MVGYSIAAPDATTSGIVNGGLQACYWHAFTVTLRYFDGIRYGSFADLEVLVDPATRELWVTQPVIERMLGFVENTARKKIASKSFKAFAGQGLAVGKKVKALDVLGRPNTVTALPFDTFLKFVYWQSKKPRLGSIVSWRGLFYRFDRAELSQYEPTQT